MGFDFLYDFARVNLQSFGNRYELDDIKSPFSPLIFRNERLRFSKRTS